ncbi:UbiA family prenyltransferase [Spirochaeta dissipatitropha]
MKLYTFMRIVEIRTKIISMSSFGLATLLAYMQEQAFQPLLFVLMLAATLLVDMGTTAFNSFYDYYRGVDALEHNREKDKVLVHDGVAPGLALLIAVILFGIAVLLGAIIAFMTSYWIAAVGALCMAVGYLYTGGRYPISFTPVGEVFAGGFLGSVLFIISYYIQTGFWDTSVLLASLPSTFLIAAILSVNNACDVQGDAAAGRKTLAVLLRPNHSSLPVPLLYAAGMFSLIIAVLLGILPIITGLVVLLGLPLSIIEFRRMYARGFMHETKGPNMESISKIFMQFSVFYAAGILASNWIYI